MKTVRIALGGFGGVGKAFVRLAAEKHQELSDRYGVNLAPAFVFHSRGYADKTSWLELAELAQDTAASLRDLPGYHSVPGGSTGLVNKLAEGGYDVLVEATPTDLKTGQPATDYLLAALQSGAHGVALNKGPLVCQWDTIKKAVKRSGCQIKVSGATAAALPTVDVGQLCLAGARVTGIRGIINGTSNYVLTLMAHQGLTWQEALRKAQDLGIAESNAQNDISGFDAAAKLVIICNVLLGGQWTLSDVSVTGITAINHQDVAAAMKQGCPVKLIARAEPSDLPGDWRLSVAPENVPSSDPLSAVSGTEKAICFTTDTMGTLLIAGGASSPMGAAAAALKDILHLFAPVGSL